MSGQRFGKGSAGYRRLSMAMFAAGFATFAQLFGAQALLVSVGEQEQVSAATAAWLVSATALGMAVSVIPWALLADAIGRTRAMTFSVVLSSILSLGIAWASTFEGAIAWRSLLGLVLGAVPALAMAYLAERVEPRWIAVAAGTFVAGNTVGGTTARLLAGSLTDPFGWKAALLVVSVLCAGLAVAFLILIPRDPHRGAAGSAMRDGMRALVGHLRDRVMVGLFAQGFLLMGCFGAVYNFLAYRLTAPPFGLPLSWVSFLFLANFIGTVASRASGPLVVRWGYLRILHLGHAAMILGLLLLLPESIVSSVAGLGVFTAGCFTAHPVASGQSAVQARRGRNQGTALYQLSWLLGASILGTAVGAVLDIIGWTTAVLCVVGCVLLAAVAARLCQGSPGSVTELGPPRG